MTRIQGQTFQNLHALLAQTAQKAYKHMWLMANPVLARFPRSGFVRIFASGEEPPETSSYFVAKRVAQCMRNSLGLVAVFLRQRRAFRQHAATRRPEPNPTVIVDTVLYAHQVLNENELKLVEFPGLLQELIAEGMSPLVAPNIHGTVSPDTARQLGARLSTEACHVLTPFDILGWSDILRLVAFAVSYPFVLLAFITGQSAGGDRVARLLRHELVDTLPAPVVPAYLRYLFGRRLGQKFPKGFTVISWWENRAGDKMFIAGLRKANAPVNIVGAQLYIFPDNYIGAYLTEAETGHGLAPDRILVNGPYYMPKDCPVPAVVGPSLRYAGLFQLPPASSGQEGGYRTVLVLLGYDPDGIRQALKTISEVRWTSDCRLVIRLHPAYQASDFAAQFPLGAVPADGDLYTCLKRASVVIGAETGAMLEAVACGIPVVNLGVLGDMSLLDMPELGSGEIWFPASTAEEVTKRLAEAQAVPSTKRLDYALRYRSEFFSKPQPGRLLEPFGLRTRPEDC